MLLIHMFDERADSPHHLLQRSWELLGRHIHFPMSSNWVNQLYPDFHRLEDRQLREYFYQDIIFWQATQRSIWERV